MKDLRKQANEEKPCVINKTKSTFYLYQDSSYKEKRYVDKHQSASINEMINYCETNDIEYVFDNLSEAEIEAEKALKFYIIKDTAESGFVLSDNGYTSGARRWFRQFEQAQEYCEKWGHPYEVIGVRTFQYSASLERLKEKPFIYAEQNAQWLFGIVYESETDIQQQIDRAHKELIKLLDAQPEDITMEHRDIPDSEKQLEEMDPNKSYCMEDFILVKKVNKSIGQLSQIEIESVYNIFEDIESVIQINIGAFDYE